MSSRVVGAVIGIGFGRGQQIVEAQMTVRVARRRR